MTRLKLDEWGSRWSFARGATKATHGTKGRSMTELTEALAEVDGLLAGINYLERLEPESEEARPPSAQIDKAKDHLPPNSAKGSWLGHLTIDLPELDDPGSEERSKIEIRHLRNILNDKLINPNENSRQVPHKSQWATLRSLRKASMYHYNQFHKVTADSASADIRKLRKSYVATKNMLEMGILTFRDVLRGQIPTTLVDIFAFASLSYVISKTLHSNGHIDESDILSGILDWRAAICDEKERSAFDEIAKKLWPEAKEIMHFFHLEKEMNPETANLKLDESETRCVQSSLRQETLDAGFLKPGEGYITSREDSLLSPWTHDTILQSNTFHMPCFNEDDPPGGLGDHAHQLVQEIQSHEDFRFSAWLNLDGTILEDITDPSFHQSTAPSINPEAFHPSQIESPIGSEFASKESPSSHYGSPQADHQGTSGDGPTLSHLLNTSLLQVVYRFVIHISEAGDLLNVLSGRGLTCGKDGNKLAHPRSRRVAFEFLDQAPKHFFEPLHHEACRIDETFSGILAMAEMFVRIGALDTVREVENYIITVGRYLAPSYDLFARLVSNTLIQCLSASRRMKWNLLYPNCAQETDEYSIEYISRKEKGEKEWANSGFACLEPLDETPSPTASTNGNPRKRSSNYPKYPDQGGSVLALKHRRRDIPNTGSPLSGSDISTTEHCPFDDCLKYYTGKAASSNLSRHVRTEHHKKKALTCPGPKCGKKFPRRDNLRQHFLKVHTYCNLPDWIAEKRRGFSN